MADNTKTSPRKTAGTKAHPPEHETDQCRARGSSTARRKRNLLERFSSWASVWAGSSWSFGVAVAVILAWLITGPIFGFSNTWQLIINSTTTIVTFLMVFLIQRSQNKEAQAVHLKLNELVAAIQGASNRLINVEDLTEDEVRTLHLHYGKLAELAQCASELTKSHSIEEAERRHKQPRSMKGAAE